MPTRVSAARDREDNSERGRKKRERTDKEMRATERQKARGERNRGEREREGESERETHIEKQKGKDRQTDRQTDRPTERGRERGSENSYIYIKREKGKRASSSSQSLGGNLLQAASSRESLPVGLLRSGIRARAGPSTLSNPAQEGRSRGGVCRRVCPHAERLKWGTTLTTFRVSQGS